MLSRRLVNHQLIRRTMSTSTNPSIPPGATAASIHDKITSSLTPTNLTIHNDSHLHAHHSAMRGNTNPETHFRVEVVSEAFKGKMQPARHRMVYKVLEEELRDVDKGGKGVHALGLVTRTPEEDEKKREKARSADSAVDSSDAGVR